MILFKYIFAKAKYQNTKIRFEFHILILNILYMYKGKVNPGFGHHCLAPSVIVVMSYSDCFYICQRGMPAVCEFKQTCIIHMLSRQFYLFCYLE